MMDMGVLASASGVVIRHVSSTPFIVALVAIPSLVLVIGLIVVSTTKSAGDDPADFIGYAAIACLLEMVLGFGCIALQDNADRANTATIESHYGISALSTDHWAMSDGSTKPKPVTFMNDAGLVHGDVVIIGDRATLYVGSSAQRTEYDGDASTASGEAGTKGDNGRSGDSAKGAGHDKGSRSDATRKERQ